MAARPNMTREEEFLIEEHPFITNAFLIICEMLDMNNPPSGESTALVDEILHSIFFLGKVQSPRFTPEEIINDKDMFNELKATFPQPFELYSSQLPKRSPFSYVLDMVVRLIGQENEFRIIQRLQELINQLEGGRKKPLVSSTICVSKTPNSDRYYGVSMSTTGCHPGRIMVAASCLSTYWDSYVAGAVMTYYPTKEKKSYFDGTLQLPQQVRCEAFNLSDARAKAPCISCGNLFGLTNSAGAEWDYGNCAEAESLSNLFKNVREVREQARPRYVTCTVQNRERAEQSVREVLQGVLRCERFRWDDHFYTVP